MHRHAYRSSIRRVAVSLGVLVAAVLAVAAGAIPASASPAGALRGPTDPISVASIGVSPNFGYAKHGTSSVRTIQLQNDGFDSWTIDPAPLSAMGAPFSLVSTTLVAGQVVDPGQTRVIVVKYTAPAAGTVSSVPVTLTVVDADSPGSMNYTMTFEGHSLETDRSYFELTTAAGGTSVDFGQVKVGDTATVTMKILVRGIDPMKFADGQITVIDTAGMPIPGVTVSQSSFGAGGLTYIPGQAPTFELSFSPTAAGVHVGTLTVTGNQMSGDPDAKNVTATMSLRAAAIAPPTSTPTPTPTPTGTPAPTGTATPTPTTSGGLAGGGTTGAGSTGSGRGGTLASTGADQTIGLGMGAIAVFGCGAAMILVRRWSRSRSRG